MALALLALLLPQVMQPQAPTEPPERVEVSDLLRAPGRYDGKRIIVSGELRSGDMEDLSRDIFQLRGNDVLREVRVGMSRNSLSGRDLRFMVGQKVVVTGIFWDLGTQCYVAPSGVQCYDPRLIEFGAVTSDFTREEKRYFVGAFSVDPVEEEPLRKRLEPEEGEETDLDIPSGELIDLRDLVARPEPYLDKRVAVIGKFRGNNLYGDLSMRTKKTPRDFVIKAADAAIWVTGKRPRGKGFRLNARMRRDTGKWLKVTGVPWSDQGMVYLKAEKLELVAKPEDPGLEPVEDEKEEQERKAAAEPPPEVIFSIPLDGERDVPLESELEVQFSADMDPASFDRNVDLLYGDDEGTGNPFPDLNIRYDRTRRALVVDPGKRLEPGKEILLILYEGIHGKNGKPLVTTATSEEPPGAAVVLRFFTAEP